LIEQKFKSAAETVSTNHCGYDNNSYCYDSKRIIDYNKIVEAYKGYNEYDNLKQELATWRANKTEEVSLLAEFHHESHDL
jgi:hypothetical protein